LLITLRSCMIRSDNDANFTHISIDQWEICRDHVIQGEGWVVVNIPFFEYKRSMPRSEKVSSSRPKIQHIYPKE